jgi:hypothetical protein
VSLAFDWQRLLHLYAYLRRTDTSPPTLDLALSTLSTAGVTSDTSRAADPTREDEYRTAAQEWVRRYRESRKNKKKKAARQKKRKLSATSAAVDGEPSGSGSVNTEAEWIPSADEIERLIAILETNSHSRDESDQIHLQDPQLPPACVANSDAQAEDGSDTGNDKDEACGLWLVSSLVNHSCLPNCTAYIPSTQGRAEPPLLYLRCIRPVTSGEQLTISYHDAELAPPDERQAQLSGRGFMCTCALCTCEIRDYTRAAACSECNGGVCAPERTEGVLRWKCDHCDEELNPEQRAAFARAEETWIGQWEDILHMVSGGQIRPDFPPALLLNALAESASEATPVNVLESISRKLAKIAPLHITHGHIYAFLKFILFEESVWLRSRHGAAGVTGVLFAMAAIVDRALGPLAVSEERRVLGYWLAREAKERLEHGTMLESDKEKWQKIQEMGLQRWSEGMRDLYGRDFP